MHGCTSGFMLIVNAEFDSMGGVIETGVGISSKPSLQQSSDLEKTQAELRQTFTAAEKFRRELEFLQKGGDPLDLKPGNAASISFQSTSLTDRHLTSEAKGSFAITASPHGDSVESSGRLGAPSVCEPNSADNLMLFDGGNNINLSKLDVGHISKESGDSAVLELPKKSYKRRIRSRPNRDGARSSSTDAVPSRGAHFLPFRHASNSNSKPKSPNELDGVPAGQSTLGPPHGPHSAVLDANVIQNTQENHQEHVDLTDSKSPPHADTVKTENFVGPTPTNGVGNTEEVKIRHDDGNNGAVIPTKVLDSESSCGQTSQRFDGHDGNSLASKEVVDVEGNNLVAEKDDKILNIDKDKNDDGSSIKEEEGVKGSESCSQNELKNSVATRKDVPDGCISSETERKHQASNDTVRQCADVAEQIACSQENLKQATKEHEDSILEEARIIEAKRKRIAELSVRTLPLERRVKSQWDFVLEEMSWLANDFAQERLWKVTAAAEISKRVAFSSRIRLKKQSSLQKQKEVSHTLAEAVMEFWHSIQVKHEESKDHGIGIQGYAMRFLEYNSSKSQYNPSQAHVATDTISDLGIMDLSWEDNLTEENLFYTVPPGAIEAYRKAIESHLLQFERTGSSMQEEVDTSGYDAVAENAFEEDEGETNTYYLPGGFEGHKSSKAAQKRRKNFKIYGGRSYEMGGDVSFGGTQPSILSGKRPATSLNVSIPTKRVRTASRQRIISPFHAGTSGSVQAPHRTDASSGDTNSFQDEQSSLHGGSQIPNNMEAESVGDYEKQLQFDSMEVSNRPKKKKKVKHPGSTFDHRWQLDSNFQSDQKDHSRRRLDAHQFDSNGSSVASQMSNMSNPNKIMKLLVRDRGRKAKALKNPVGQPGSGSPWSLFEDQALVVLVHDMGPNWELISDAINSTLQFKCIFRKSKECKERHKILMDRNTGDGADSAEDSGNSQPYPSTLPGIPEGSARQLFQRLQGPMEEDTLKSHFEKIIMIGHKQHYRRTQNDNQDPKQLQQPHTSHAFALSQVIPNNLNGGPVLTPLELSEPISTSPDAPLVGFQGPGGLPVLNHGTGPPMLPGSGPTPSAPASSNSNLPSASSPLNPSVREGRYGIPRTGLLSVDDQQKLQPYNQMLSARNANQSSLPPGSHSVTDRGVRMLPAGSGMGVMCGMTRGIKMARPPSSLLPTPTSAQGNSMLRSHMIQPNQNTDRQKMAADGQMQQTSQSGGGGGVPPLPPVQSYPLHHQQPPRPISPQQSPRVLNPNSHHPHHFQGPTNPQHPAFGMRFAKERQLQQQRLRQQQQQQQQFPTSNPVMPPQDSQSQLPASSPPVPLVPSQKHPVPSPHGIMRTPQSITNNNQIGKQQQRPRQQFPQPKLMKGGRGGSSNSMMTTDINGFSGAQSSATADKVEQKVLHQHHMMYSGKQPLPHQQTTKQLQQQKPSDNNNNTNQNQNHASTPSVVATSSNNHQKLPNQKQTINPQKVLLNRKVNPSESASPVMPVSTSQMTTPVNDGNSSETAPVVAGDNAKNSSSVRLSPPQSGGAGAESGSSEVDVGVQWQQKPPS